MYILIKDKNIKQYPYSIGQLKADNPQTSFPYNITEETIEEFGVYPVVPAEYPQVDYTKNVIEETPKLINGIWYQNYTVVDATESEIAERKSELNTQATINRSDSYRNESDSLFFKWQRGQSTQQEWLDKVNEIKARFPKE